VSLLDLFSGTLPPLNHKNLGGGAVKKPVDYADIFDTGQLNVIELFWFCSTHKFLKWDLLGITPFAPKFCNRMILKDFSVFSSKLA